MLGLKLIHVSKRGPWWQACTLRNNQKIDRVPFYTVTDQRSVFVSDNTSHHMISWSHEAAELKLVFLNYRVALEFDWRLDSSAAREELPGRLSNFRAIEQFQI